MKPTPDLSHLEEKDYENVYEPAEDTFILLDALEADTKLFESLNPSICLEVGVGSGCVSTFLSNILRDGSLFLGTDINEHAARVSTITATRNKATLDVVNTDLFGSFTDRLMNSIDIILFNPPYVPTLDEEHAISRAGAAGSSSSNAIYAAWAGGEDGMRTTNIFLANVKNMLKKDGLMYLVGVKENNPTKIAQDLTEQGMSCEIVLQRLAGRERLFVLRGRKL